MQLVQFVIFGTQKSSQKIEISSFSRLKLRVFLAVFQGTVSLSPALRTARGGGHILYFCWIGPGGLILVLPPIRPPVGTAAPRPGPIQLSLGFFSEIRVPPHLMQQPSRFDEAQGLWVWGRAALIYPGGNPTPTGVGDRRQPPFPARQSLRPPRRTLGPGANSLSATPAACTEDEAGAQLELFIDLGAEVLFRQGPWPRSRCVRRVQCAATRPHPPPPYAHSVPTLGNNGSRFRVLPWGNCARG